MNSTCLKRASFQWTRTKNTAAAALADGMTHKAAAVAAGCAERSIRNWLAVSEFAEEVDRLTFLTDIAQKAERLRLAKRIVRKLGDRTERDLLDWLKYVQSEVEKTGVDLLLTQINFGALPSETIDRLAAGENPARVLAGITINGGNENERTEV